MSESGIDAHPRDCCAHLRDCRAHPRDCCNAPTGLLHKKAGSLQDGQVRASAAQARDMMARHAIQRLGRLSQPLFGNRYLARGPIASRGVVAVRSYRGPC